MFTELNQAIEYVQKKLEKHFSKELAEIKEMGLETNGLIKTILYIVTDLVHQTSHPSVIDKILLENGLYKDFEFAKYLTAMEIYELSILDVMVGIRISPDTAQMMKKSFGKTLSKKEQEAVISTIEKMAAKGLDNALDLQFGSM